MNANARRPFGARKFFPGREVEGLQDLVGLIVAGAWVYWCDGRPLNPAIAQNMSIATLRGAFMRGGREHPIRVALTREAHIEWIKSRRSAAEQETVL